MKRLYNHNKMEKTVHLRTFLLILYASASNFAEN